MFLSVLWLCDRIDSPAPAEPYEQPPSECGGSGYGFAPRLRGDSDRYQLDCDGEPLLHSALQTQQACHTVTVSYCPIVVVRVSVRGGTLSSSSTLQVTWPEMGEFGPCGI